MDLERECSGMRAGTYYKLESLYEKHRGYISTKELLDEGLSNRQIAGLTEENYLEKICHGYYWMVRSGCKKPWDYKCVEVCLGNPRAVIAMKSACYYQGVIQIEPEVLTVATERTDRSMIKMNFPVERHYFSTSNFRIGMRRMSTEFGNYNIYDVERSYCDMMRLNETNSDDRFMIEVADCIKAGRGKNERIQKYAQMFNLRNSL